MSRKCFFFPLMTNNWQFRVLSKPVIVYDDWFSSPLTPWWGRYYFWGCEKSTQVNCNWRLEEARQGWQWSRDSLGMGRKPSVIPSHCVRKQRSHIEGGWVKSSMATGLVDFRTKQTRGGRCFQFSKSRWIDQIPVMKHRWILDVLNERCHTSSR